MPAAVSEWGGESVSYSPSVTETGAQGELVGDSTAGIFTPLRHGLGFTSPCHASIVAPISRLFFGRSPTTVLRGVAEVVVDAFDSQPSTAAIAVSQSPVSESPKVIPLWAHRDPTLPVEVPVLGIRVRASLAHPAPDHQEGFIGLGSPSPVSPVCGVGGAEPLALDTPAGQGVSGTEVAIPDLYLPVAAGAGAGDLPPQHALASHRKASQDFLDGQFTPSFIQLRYDRSHGSIISQVHNQGETPA